MTPHEQLIEDVAQKLSLMIAGWNLDSMGDARRSIYMLVAKETLALILTRLSDSDDATRIAQEIRAGMEGVTPLNHLTTIFRKAEEAAGERKPWAGNPSLWPDVQGVKAVAVTVRSELPRDRITILLDTFDARGARLRLFEEAFGDFNPLGDYSGVPPPGLDEESIKGRGDQYDALLDFQSELITLFEPPNDLTPEQLTPWLRDQVNVVITERNALRSKQENPKQENPNG